MFVCFFLKVHRPPLDTSESHAECHRGEAPRPGLESPIGTQRPGEGSAPAGGAEGRRRRFDTLFPQHASQIWFHAETGAAAAVWVFKKKKKFACARVAQHTETHLTPAQSVDRELSVVQIPDVKCH